MGEDPIRRDGLRPPSGEEPLQVVDRVLDPAERLPTVRAVLVDQQRGEVVESRLVGVGYVRALMDLRLPLLELLARAAREVVRADRFPDDRSAQGVSNLDDEASLSHGWRPRR
jgi:hypothetical protein